jgi:hypothetical protein
MLPSMGRRKIFILEASSNFWGMQLREISYVVLCDKKAHIVSLMKHSIWSMSKVLRKYLRQSCFLSYLRPKLLVFMHKIIKGSRYGYRNLFWKWMEGGALDIHLGGCLPPLLPTSNMCINVILYFTLIIFFAKVMDLSPLQSMVYCIVSPNTSTQH